MIEVCIESGRTRVFASAVDWPGWARSGRDEAAASQALIVSAPRYKKALGALARELKIPKRIEDLRIVERLTGNSTTDFGAPDKPPSIDATPLDPKELKHLTKILDASWNAFERSATAAGRRALAKGPRGGGRDVAKMREHVLEGQMGYLGAIGGRFKPTGARYDIEMRAVRAAVIEALGARVRGELLDKGPRGGHRWTARYAIRRSAWHALDHAWEIEDRLS